MTDALRTEIVDLTGAPEDVGRAFGQAAKVAIQRDVAGFLETVAASDVTGDELERRVEYYQRIVGRLAPHWNVEMAEIARNAGVAEADYLAHVAQKYVIKARPPVVELQHECTSFLAVAGGTADGRSILHKNRDSTPRPQGLWVRGISGTNRYLGGGDASDHGVIHFVNEHGLAGAMNAGSPNSDSEPTGLPTPQILRLIAERAANCADALAILEEIVREGWYTNGTNGSLWFFVEPGRGMVVENTRHHIDHTWIDEAHARANDFFLPNTLPFTREDAFTNTRYLTAQAGVERIRGRLTAAEFNCLSRNTASEPQRICGDHTLSGFTAVIGTDPEADLPMAWVALGHPNNSLYVPWFVAAEGTPAFVLDGTLWDLSARLHAANPLGPNPHLGVEAFENEIDRELEQVRAQAAPAMRDGHVNEARSLVTEASAGWALRAAAALTRAATGVATPA